MTPMTEAGASVRATRQRAAISTLLETLDEFRSAQELHDELRRRGENIGLTTVYRTLQSMAAAGMLDTLRTDTGESVYRRCSEHHHHHLVCRSCGADHRGGRSRGRGVGGGSGQQTRILRRQPHHRDLRHLLGLPVLSGLSPSARGGSGRRCPAPAGSGCAARRRSGRRRESCSAASRLRSWPHPCRSCAARPSR